MTKTKKQSRLTKALLEMSADLHKSGLMGDADYNKITQRLGKKTNSPGPTSDRGGYSEKTKAAQLNISE